MDKLRLLRRLINKFEEKLARTNKSLERTQKDVVEAPGRMSSRYDSTKQESSYLADSFSKRYSELQQVVNSLQELPKSVLEKSCFIKIGSIVNLKETGRREEEWYFILPVGGGETLCENMTEILVVSPYSPLATCLLGKKKGDTAKLVLAKDSRELEILEVW